MEAIWTKPSFVLEEQGATPLHKILANRAVAIEAPAGFGKTTLSKIVALSLGKDFLRQPCPNAQSWQSLYLGVDSGESPHFPIFVDLRRLENFSGPYSLLTEATPAIDESEIPHFRILFETRVPPVFILDGLDEVDAYRRSRIFELVAKARLQWEGVCYFIVTSRNYEVEALASAGFCLARMHTFVQGRDQ